MNAPELDDLADEVGQFMEYWGFKKIHGIIWLHLFLSHEPLDAGELIKRIGISKASVSVTLKELTEFGVILEAGKGPKGTRTYRAVEDVVQPILKTIRRRERRMIGRIQASFDQLRSLSLEQHSGFGINASRMEMLGEMIHLAKEGLDSFVNRNWVSISQILLKGRKMRRHIEQSWTRDHGHPKGHETD